MYIEVPMVFGFGKKKTRESSSAPHRDIRIGTIPNILKEIESPVMNQVIERARKIRNDRFNFFLQVGSICFFYLFFCIYIY